ncbi:MAG TPA: hypothetical protein VFY17_04895 [Pilimelia sp.]|nr:hypothetical protein [Pilimelia sp.]
MELDERECAPPPGTLTGAARGLVRGAYRVDDRWMLTLDVDVAAGTP